MLDGGPLLHRRAGGDDPDHRHQRRADRDLAPLVVARRAPPAARRLRRLHPQLPHALVHDRVLLGDRDGADHPRARPTSWATSTASARCSRSRSRTSRSWRCASRTRPRDRPYRAPWNVNWQRQAGAADRGARRDRDRRRLRLGGRPPHRGADRRYRLDGRRDGRLLPLPPPPGARPARRRTGSSARSGRSASSRSPTARRWCRSSAPTSAPRRWRARRSWSARTPRSRPSTCSRSRGSCRSTGDWRRRSAGPPRARGRAPAGQASPAQGALQADPHPQPRRARSSTRPRSAART